MSNFNAIAAALANLNLLKGDGVVLDAYITDPNNNDLPVDLTLLANLTMQVKRKKTDSEYLVQLTIGSGLSIEGLGILRITLSNTDTNLTPAKYWYDIQGVLSGRNRTILEGKYIINQDVTT